MYYVDRGRRIRYWNHGAARLSGYAASDVVGHFCYDNILNHVDSSGTSLCRSLCPLAATMRDGEPRKAEVFLRHRQGHRVPIQVRTAPVRDREGTIIGGVEIFEDATRLSAVRREVSELRDLAMHDALTGLPDRRHFEMAMASRIAELAGYGRRFGLLIADIDGSSASTTAMAMRPVMSPCERWRARSWPPLGPVTRSPASGARSWP